MNRKPVVFTKQIHSSCSSFSSDDVFLKAHFSLENLDFELTEGVINTNLAPLVGETISKIEENIFLIEVYLEDDKTFYKTGDFLRSATKDEMNKLVEGYTKKGWRTESDYLQNKVSNERGFLQRQLRNYEGFVIPEWTSDLPIASYRGALPPNIFLDKELQDYLSEGGCHGYIGHSQRTFDTDRALVKIARKRNATDKQIADFLSHSAGRHFADQLSCAEDVEKYFDEYFVYRHSNVGLVK